MGHGIVQDVPSSASGDPKFTCRVVFLKLTWGKSGLPTKFCGSFCGCDARTPSWFDKVPKKIQRFQRRGASWSRKRHFETEFGMNSVGTFWVTKSCWIEPTCFFWNGMCTHLLRLDTEAKNYSPSQLWPISWSSIHKSDSAFRVGGWDMLSIESMLLCSIGRGGRCIR